MRRRARRAVEKSLSMVTSLNPHIGYDEAAKLAKEAFRTGKTIRELCRRKADPAGRHIQKGARSVEHDRAARVGSPKLHFWVACLRRASA